jgi:hypothetical protein
MLFSEPKSCNFRSCNYSVIRGIQYARPNLGLIATIVSIIVYSYQVRRVNLNLFWEKVPIEECSNHVTRIVKEEQQLNTRQQNELIVIGKEKCQQHIAATDDLDVKRKANESVLAINKKKKTRKKKRMGTGRESSSKKA